jgi:hypothetical protein
MNTSLKWEWGLSTSYKRAFEVLIEDYNIYKYHKLSTLAAVFSKKKVKLCYNIWKSKVILDSYYLTFYASVDFTRWLKTGHYLQKKVF